jgi:hypothetical protein
MPMPPPSDTAPTENERLIAELEKAEAYEQKLRQVIVDVRAELLAGRVATALSMLNEALNFIDNATDVVAPHGPLRG